MKYIVLLCDGMADLPVNELDGKTPMEAACKPNMDKLAGISELGMVKTVQDGMKPGSDVANLSVLGYDPALYYSGRSPLEAGSIGIGMKPTDVSFRCNLVTLSEDENYEDKIMLDYCADDISTSDARVLIEFIERELGTEEFRFYNGVSYRHCLIWENGTLDVGVLTPPHDISDKKITDYLGVNEKGALLLEMMKKSYNLLKNHPLNLERVKQDKRPANSIWLWGEGVKKPLPLFMEKYNVKGAMISAVDLLKGIGKFTGMEVIEVAGATGYLDTNFAGKAQAAINTLKKNNNFVYIHIEAPDECGHRNETGGKVKSIELIDKLVLEPILKEFEGEEFKILICPDHPTPLALKTHTNEPVPYLIYDSRKKEINNKKVCFSEKTAEETGVYIAYGYTLMARFLNE